MTSVVCVIISFMKRLVYVLVIVVFLTPARVFAASSTNYSVEESSFSSGSGFGTSTSYGAQGSIGDFGGAAYSTNYGAYAGPITPNEEYLEVFVDAATIDFGTLSSSVTSTGTASFYVRAYLNSSYSVVTLSQPPTSENGDTIAPLTSSAAPSTGTEQFGINLVANTSPAIGADPAHQPDSTYANGVAATGYDTDGQFRYNAGESIASSTGEPAWGQTNFTISYIANISVLTEAGSYQMVHELAAVPTF